MPNAGGVDLNQVLHKKYGICIFQIYFAETSNGNNHLPCMISHPQSLTGGGNVKA
jgi:hypothetical protein